MSRRAASFSYGSKMLPRFDACVRVLISLIDACSFAAQCRQQRAFSCRYADACRGALARFFR